FFLGAFGGHDLHIGGHGGHAGHAGGAHGHGHGDAHHISPFNLSTISAFVTWFVGAGWLLTKYSGLAGPVILLASTAAGSVGGGIVFLVLARYVMPRLTVMRPEDYREQGGLGRLTVPIREGGVGEVVYTL